MTTQTTPLAAPPETRRRFGTVALLAVGVLIGAAAGAVLGRLLKAHGTAHHLSAWAVCLVPILALLAIALHEAGHVAAGLLSGFRFYMYVVGPLRIEREGERLRFKFNRMPSLWGGLAGCTPRSFGPELRRQMMVFTAGGPLASALGAAVLLAAWAQISNASFFFVALAFGVLSLGLALVTLIPMSLQGFTSDGARLWMLWRNRPEGKRWTAMAAVAGLSLVDRPRQWPAEFMELLGDGLDFASDAVSVCLLRYLWHMDRREWEAARLWLERGLAHIEALPKAFQGGFYASAAYFYARLGESPALARRYLERARKPGVYNPKDLHAVTAAVLVAEGRHEEARSELELAAAALKSKSPAIAAAGLEDIQEMRAALG